MTSDILFDLLNERYTVTRYGRGVSQPQLPLPTFYFRDTPLLPGEVYVARTQDLPPRPQAECLFICIGGRPSHIGSGWPGEVLYAVGQEQDLLTLFNTVQGIYKKIARWTEKMRELVASGAELESLIQASIPLFENRITITDNNLQVLAYCEAVETAGHKEIRLCRRFERIPEEKSVMFENFHRQSTKRREPYIYQEPVNGQMQDRYCINLYLDDLYVGCCSLCEDLRPLRDSDYLLFQQFAGYVRQALAGQSRTPTSRFATLRTLLSELLQCFPVSRGALDRAIGSARLTAGLPMQEDFFWRCIVIRSDNRGKTLPAQYLCESLEKMLPACTAVSCEGILAAYCMFPKNDPEMDSLLNVLDPYLRDMNFRAGISAPFEDICKAHSYYLQGLAILDTGHALDSVRYTYSFEAYVLYYMLQHCYGAFEPEMLLTQNLISLFQDASGVDYLGTLRQYLDNECNASRTAQELFLHRSTLQTRLDKIKSLVEMDTPEQRLYLRMCVYLYDSFLNRKDTAKGDTVP